jgi:hypothetical protein
MFDEYAVLPGSPYYDWRQDMEDEKAFNDELERLAKLTPTELLKRKTA